MFRNIWGWNQQNEEENIKVVNVARIDYFKKFKNFIEWGSGAIIGKMLLVRILKIIKLTLILGQVRLSKG